MTHFDVIVLGAGAAGMMCAFTAGRRERRVLLLDHADEAGKKILISGGGRCNFTNRETRADRFFSANPHFAKSALARYTPNDFVALVDQHGIAYHEKTLGQLFCDGSARAVVAMLLAECEAAHVDLRLAHRITSVTRSDRFEVSTDHGAFTADSLVIATGGLSIPKMGATGLAHFLAERFGLPVVGLRPGLVPLTFTGEAHEMMQPLSGVSLECSAQCERMRFREAMLFTHRGLSGPAVLQISSVWREGGTITLDMMPGLDARSFLVERKRDRPKAALKTVLSERLPQRLAQALADDAERPMAELPDRLLTRVAERVNRWKLTPNGSEGYAKAEVTLGGISTSALSSQTMEARDVAGLYAIGEAVDVTGWLGGYNFQWAWASGWCAGMAA